MFALLLPVLIGGVALGAETGYWYMLQRQAQHAADMAAYSAVVRMVRENDAASARAGAIDVAHGSGVPAGTSAVVVTITGDTSAGAISAEVLITDTRERLFTRIFLDGPVDLRARAVAQVARDDRGVPVCMLSLASDADRAVWLDGAADVDLGHCAVEARSTSASAFFSGGSSHLRAGCVNLIGGAQGNPVTTILCDNVRTNSSVRDVPVQLVSLPEVSGATSVPAEANNRLNNASFTPQDIGHPSGVPVARFRNGLNMQGNVTLGRGLYIIDGGTLSTQGWSVIDASAGAAFYLINGARVAFANNTTADLQAMRDGPWKDILFFDTQDAASAQTHVLVTTRTTGAIYTPRATIEFRGGTGVDDGCFMMVMNRLYFTGSAKITANCAESHFDFDTFGLGGGAEGWNVIKLVQ